MVSEPYSYTDSNQLSHAITRDNTIDERCVMIDILAKRKPYKRFDVTGVVHMSGTNNPGDWLRKMHHNSVFDKVIKNGEMRNITKRWIDRGDIHVTNRSEQ